MNLTSLCYWWPRIHDLGIPVPRTEIVLLPQPTSAAVAAMTCVVHPGNHDVESPSCETELSRMEPELRAAGERIGYPLFLRTDMLSGKHSYRDTCLVPEADALWDHVFRLAEEHEMALWLERDNDLTAFIFRELIDLNSRFTAFQDFPIAPERRYFIKDGSVVCHHPYWFEDVIKGNFWQQQEEPKNWRRDLRHMSKEGQSEIATLSAYARQVAAALPGEWSVDFALTRAGEWYLIDMAIAARSWHPRECLKYIP